jgi:hypothetical protein
VCPVFVLHRAVGVACVCSCHIGIASASASTLNLPPARARRSSSCHPLALNEREQVLRLLAGVIEPMLQELARKYNCDKKVCRK